MVREKLEEARSILQTLYDCLEGVERDNGFLRRMARSLST